MQDLWPDFSSEHSENNDALTIIKSQVFALERKTNGKVKARFTKATDNKLANLGMGLNNFSLALLNASENDDLASKRDANDFFTITRYIFEIYSDTYRFRVFILNYRDFYPIELIPDEGIKLQMTSYKNTNIYSNEELQYSLSTIFSTQKMKDIILHMIRTADKTDINQKSKS